MKIRVMPGPGLIVLLPSELGGGVVPAEGMEVDDTNLFIRRRLEDGDLVVAAGPNGLAPMGE